MRMHSDFIVLLREIGREESEVYRADPPAGGEHDTSVGPEAMRYFKLELVESEKIPIAVGESCIPHQKQIHTRNFPQ